jgi:hypothetical protein
MLVACLVWDAAAPSTYERTFVAADALVLKLREPGFGGRDVSWRNAASVG